jgi:hypothetical protein
MCGGDVSCGGGFLRSNDHLDLDGPNIVSAGISSASIRL